MNNDNDNAAIADDIATATATLTLGEARRLYFEQLKASDARGHYNPTTGEMCPTVAGLNSSDRKLTKAQLDALQYVDRTGFEKPRAKRSTHDAIEHLYIYAVKWNYILTAAGRDTLALAGRGWAQDYHVTARAMESAAIRARIAGRHDLGTILRRAGTAIMAEALMSDAAHRARFMADGMTEVADETETNVTDEMVAEAFATVGAEMEANADNIAEAMATDEAAVVTDEMVATKLAAEYGILTLGELRRRHGAKGGHVDYCVRRAADGINGLGRPFTKAQLDTLQHIDQTGQTKRAQPKTRDAIFGLHVYIVDADEEILTDLGRKVLADNGRDVMPDSHITDSALYRAEYAALRTHDNDRLNAVKAVRRALGGMAPIVAPRVAGFAAVALDAAENATPVYTIIDRDAENETEADATTETETETETPRWWSVVISDETGPVDVPMYEESRSDCEAEAARCRLAVEAGHVVEVVPIAPEQLIILDDANAIANAESYKTTDEHDGTQRQEDAIASLAAGLYAIGRDHAIEQAEAVLAELEASPAARAAGKFVDEQGRPLTHVIGLDLTDGRGVATLLFSIEASHSYRAATIARHKATLMCRRGIFAHSLPAVTSTLSTVITLAEWSDRAEFADGHGRLEGLSLNAKQWIADEMLTRDGAENLPVAYQTSDGSCAACLGEGLVPATRGGLNASDEQCGTCRGSGIPIPMVGPFEAIPDTTVASIPTSASPDAAIMGAEAKLAEAHKAIRLILCIDDMRAAGNGHRNPETVVLGPASRQQLIDALGGDYEAEGGDVDVDENDEDSPGHVVDACSRCSGTGKVTAGGGWTTITANCRVCAGLGVVRRVVEVAR